MPAWALACGGLRCNFDSDQREKPFMTLHTGHRSALLYIESFE